MKNGLEFPLNSVNYANAISLTTSHISKLSILCCYCTHCTFSLTVTALQINNIVFVKGHVDGFEILTSYGNFKY